MYKKLKAISIHHLGKEFKRIWNEIIDIKESISEIKKALNIPEVVDVSEESIESVVEPVEDVIENIVEEENELSEFDRAKLKAESMGIKVHHKAKIESILSLIKEKENA